MLIPSIDLMGGKIVQLVQGEKKALEFDDFDAWTARFAAYPIVQLIDLDAAMRKGENAELVARFCAKLPCQVGGGIRSLEKAQQVLALGAKKAIIGSALFKTFATTRNASDETDQGEGHDFSRANKATSRGEAALAAEVEKLINLKLAKQLANTIGPEHLIFAIDSRAGRVAISGWTESTSITPADAARALEPYCSAFLYTNIETEGLMQGFPFDTLEPIRRATSRKLIAAGGITTQEEIARLDDLGIDAVVGMAIYTGRLTA